jgi:hypothetical protein
MQLFSVFINARIRGVNVLSGLRNSFRYIQFLVHATTCERRWPNSCLSDVECRTGPMVRGKVDAVCCSCGLWCCMLLPDQHTPSTRMIQDQREANEACSCEFQWVKMLCKHVPGIHSNDHRKEWENKLLLGGPVTDLSCRSVLFGSVDPPVEIDKCF